jgi:DNA-binding response OmpR family regulator
MKILAVEDDQEVAETVTMAFSMRWPEAHIESRDTCKSALEALAKVSFDLVILDVNLPDGDGFSLLETIRKTSRVPVIMLTVHSSESARVRGLEMGADDYVVKPFSAFELLARASAVLRRGSDSVAAGPPCLLQAGSIKLNPQTAEVFVQERPVRLTPTEFKILMLLAQNAGKVVTHRSLIQEIWGITPRAAEAYLVKLHIRHLRRKLGDQGSQPKIILNVRGFGYKLAC